MLQVKLIQSQVDQDMFIEKEKDLKKEIDRLTDLLDNKRNQLDKEICKRIDMEIENNKLKNDIILMEQVHKQKLEHTYTKDVSD